VLGGAGTAGWRHWTEDAGGAAELRGGGAAGAHACRCMQRWRAAWGDACRRLSARTARQQRHSRGLWRRCAAHKRFCWERWARCAPKTRPCAAQWPLCMVSCRRSTMSWPSFAALCRNLSQEGRLWVGILLWRYRRVRTVKAEPPLAPLRLPARPPRRLSRRSARLSSLRQLLCLPHPLLPPSRRATVAPARTPVRGAIGCLL